MTLKSEPGREYHAPSPWISFIYIQVLYVLSSLHFLILYWEIHIAGREIISPPHELVIEWYSFSDVAIEVCSFNT